MERSTGDWFQTFTGRAWWPMAPRPEDVDLRDIAHGLAFQCRFNGHCSKFYSVANHSLIVSSVMEEDGPESALAGLLHDAAEAYLGDVIRPLKRQLPRFYEIERLNQAAIFEGLGVPFGPDAFADAIREVDLIALATERRDLMAEPPLSWVSVENVEPLPEPLIPLSISYSHDLFVQRFWQLLESI